MKESFFAIVLIVAMAASVSCGSSPKFSDITGKEWKLIEVHIDGRDIDFDRSVLANDGFSELFTLNFDAQNISGVGAPNRYSAPYTQDKNQTISIKLARSTMMASIREPEKLKEQDYFVYIQNAYEWKLDDKNLRLLSKTEAGAEVVLVFTL